MISLEFAPLTKGIKICNIPQDTSFDAIKYKFSNSKIGGGKVTDIMLDRNNEIANVYFQKTSGRKWLIEIAEERRCQCCHVIILFNRYIYVVVSALVKKKHAFKDVAVTVIPY